MKKVFALSLVIALVFSLAIPVSAAVSPAAKEDDLKPAYTTNTPEAEYVLCSAEDLPEEDQTVFAEAKEALADVVPEGMAVRYFLYLDVLSEDGTVTFKIDVGEFSELIFMMYIDGEWVEVEYTISDNGDIIIQNVTEGPLAIFIK